MRPTYQVETLAQAWPQAQELLKAHWREIAIDQDTIELSIAEEQYRHIEAAGQLIIVTMRADEGLVGYYVGFIRPHLHYAKALHCFTDIFYITPRHRRGRNAIDLFKAVERALSERQVVRWYTSCKLSLDMLPLFEALGFTQIERNFAKLVERS
jgi:Acetyltransferase (GNAT) family